MFGFKKKEKKVPSRAIMNALEEKKRLGKKNLKIDLARYMDRHKFDKLDDRRMP